MTPLEQREIRGISVKQAWVFIAGVITIVASVVGTYYKTMSKLEAMQMTNSLNIVQVDINKTKIEKLDDDIRTLQMRITVLETKISRYESK